ncbi:hypothetical protein A3A46_02470 [Candidatus Roizmanbacteria bacterium RIFCSPLOWO2_01_FULL_37_13]|nr:MAG: hypothetical protein A3A46_02470 [Candidatus Roizmanbacteria bacterium RIFCSPLOWO2_01_FULL_37_13]
MSEHSTPTPAEASQIAGINTDKGLQVPNAVITALTRHIIDEHGDDHSQRYSHLAAIVRGVITVHSIIITQEGHFLLSENPTDDPRGTPYTEVYSGDL